MRLSDGREAGFEPDCGHRDACCCCRACTAQNKTYAHLHRDTDMVQDQGHLLSLFDLHKIGTIHGHSSERT